MPVENIIVILKDGELETWGSLTEICRERKEFNYRKLTLKKFPFEYMGYTFHKVPYRVKLIGV